MIRVAFQGERGAYSEAAVAQRWGTEAEPIPKTLLEDVFDSVENEEANSGLIPVENTTEGTVTRTLDLLYERTLSIRGEEILRVSHCLLTNRGVRLNDVVRVYSHPQALGQVRGFLHTNGIEAMDFYDTAGAAKMIRERGFMDAGAIASGRAAEIYGLDVLAEAIESHDGNFTRFLEIGKREVKPTGRIKTTIAFALREGTSISAALEILISNGLGLTMIDTRPLIGKPWEYLFFVDFDGDRNELGVGKTLKILVNKVENLKVLGSYPMARGSFFCG